MNLPLARLPAMLALSAAVLLAIASLGCDSDAAPAAGGPPPAEVSVAIVEQFGHRNPLEG